MLKKIMLILPAACALLVAGSCGSSKSNTNASPNEITSDMIEKEKIDKVMKGDTSMFMPTAVIYRTNGDYNDNVPVSVDRSDNSIISYPAPSDLTANSTPVEVGDGWLLDRRGIGAKTCFTRYTYAEYSALSQAPSTEELLKAIIPGARVSAIRKLPMTVSAAEADLGAVKRLVADSLESLPLLYSAPTIHIDGAE